MAGYELSERLLPQASGFVRSLPWVAGRLFAPPCLLPLHPAHGLKFQLWLGRTYLRVEMLLTILIVVGIIAGLVFIVRH